MKEAAESASFLIPQARQLIQHVYVFLGANVFEDPGPHRNTDFAEVSLAKEKHQSAGLADSAADRERNLVCEYGAMVRQPQEVELPGKFELPLQAIFRHPDAHGCEFVAALGDRVPYQDVAIETVGGIAGFLARVRYPIVVVGGAHFVRISVL